MIRWSATCLLFALLAARAGAAEFHPPESFNDHPWGTPLTDFKGLMLWQASTAHDAPGKVVDFRIDCKPDPVTGAMCSPIYSDVSQDVRGDGTFALAEYYFHFDRNPFHSQGADVRIVSYLFCASAKGTYLRKPLKNYLKLCGARVTFKSDTARELAKREVNYASNYDRILARLVADFGEPPGYERRARVTVTTEDESVSSVEKPRPQFVRYQWCGVSPASNELRPSCPANVALVFEALSGEGTVLFVTGPVYDFANAVHELGDTNNDLYVMLNGTEVDFNRPRVRQDCTGSHICQPGKSTVTAKQMREFEP